MASSRILSPFISNKKTSVEQKQYILEAVIKAIYSNRAPPQIKLHLQQFLQVIFHADKGIVFSKIRLFIFERIGMVEKKLGSCQGKATRGTAK